MISHDVTPGPRGGTHADGPVKNPRRQAKARSGGEARRASGRNSARHRHRGAPQSPGCEVFAVREFSGLWYGQVLSSAGDQFAQIAVAIGVYQRTSSPFLTALVYAMSYLPQVIGGPLLAELASLFRRRTLLIGLNLTRAALVAVMASSRPPFAALCALLVTTVMLGASFSDARSAMLPEVLPPGKLETGTGLGSLSGRAGQVLGFLAGGALVIAVRPRGILLLDVLVFLAAAGVVGGLITRRPVPLRRAAARPLALPVTRAEAAAVVRQPRPRTLMLIGWLASCAVVPEALAAPYAHALHGGMITAGLLMTAIPAGALAGAAAITFLARPSAQLQIMRGLAAASCAPLAASSLHPPLWAVLVLWAAAGAAGAYQLAAVAAFVRALPAGDRASGVDLAQSGLVAVQGAGLLAAGAAAQLIGPQAAVTITGLVGVAVAATLGGTWRRLCSPAGGSAPC
jgi:MFS family permease